MWGTMWKEIGESRRICDLEVYVVVVDVAVLVGQTPFYQKWSQPLFHFQQDYFSSRRI